MYRWIRDQQKSEGVTPGEDVYIILRLDGRVRRSGKVNAYDEVYLFIYLFADIWNNQFLMCYLATGKTLKKMKAWNLTAI